MNNRPIGIFDSGIGGLTVVKAIERLLPNESFIYLGDTARVPYGTRGTEIITEFSLQLTRFLLEKKVKLLVIACNTISATCLDEIQKLSPVPVIGVIKPAAKKIVETTKNKKVGVLGTRATVASRHYEQEIQALNPDIHITSLACPLFVPLAEEGLGTSNIAQLTAKYYLATLKDIDTIHLGCTHYPLLQEVIQETLGNSVTIIDSASPTSETLKKRLSDANLFHDDSIPPTKTFYVTDAPERVKIIASLFLGRDISDSLHKTEVSD